MASAYPGGLDTLPTNHADNVNEIIHAADIDNLSDAINKIEAELGIAPRIGTWPAGSFTSVVDRLNALDNPTLKTITPPYTLILADAKSILECHNTSAAGLTIPTNASVAFPIGTSIAITMAAATAPITIAGATGVTVQSFNGLVASAGDFAWIAAIKVGTNFWRLAGDLA